mgnify:CR=1 FL=1
MKKKILLAILLIVLLGAGIGYTCFATDMLKTKKQLFFSYLLSDDLTSDLKSEDLSKYLEKEKTTAFSNKGEITANVKDNGESSDAYDLLSNGKIKLEGKVDNSQKKAEQEITVALAQGINVPIKIRRDGETYGIQSRLLYDKYIAVKNENLKSLFEKLGMDNSNEIPNQIDWENIQFTTEELQNIKDKYSRVFYNSVDNDMFEKSKVDGQTKVTVNMTADQFVSIIEKMANELKNDEKLLNKLSDGTTVDELKKQIDEFVNALKDVEHTEQDKMSISLYIKSRTLVKCEINTTDENGTETIATAEKEDNKLTVKTFEANEMQNQISIAKDENTDATTYTINVLTQDLGEGSNIQIKMGFKNLSKLDDVEESIEATIEYGEDSNKSAMQINYNNTITFIQNAEIESFNSDNVVVLNDTSEDELNNLLETIYENLGLE